MVTGDMYIGNQKKKNKSRSVKRREKLGKGGVLRRRPPAESCPMATWSLASLLELTKCVCACTCASLCVVGSGHSRSRQS